MAAPRVLRKTASDLRQRLAADSDHNVRCKPLLSHWRRCFRAVSGWTSACLAMPPSRIPVLGKLCVGGLGQDGCLPIGDTADWPAKQPSGATLGTGLCPFRLTETALRVSSSLLLYSR
jgi:hypothetical protein